MEANLWLVTKKIIETRRWPFINLKNSNKFFCGCASQENQIFGLVDSPLSFHPCVVAQKCSSFSVKP